MTTTLSRTELLLAMDSAHVALNVAIAGIPDDRMAVPAIDAWSISELLAHLTGWDELAARDCARLASGGVPALATFKSGDVDAWNAAHLRLRRGIPPAQASSESDEAWHGLAETLRNLPDALYAEGKLARMYGDITVQHKQQHAHEVRLWRLAQGV